ncbi:hypothetical protein [Flagellimonas lutimaris]|uniref:hypothetical protein n=1 Tax=Flagellimonas lutimaris TaxID=475082 RepID=UPI003F5CC2BD
MKKIKVMMMVLAISYATHAQWDTTTISNEVSTTDEIVGPVLRISNEIRIPNTFIPTDPTIGTLDNSHYGINLNKTNGIGFAFNGIHQMVFKPNGDTGIGTASPMGRLHVSTGTSGDAILRLEADTDNNNESDNPLIQLRQDGGQVGVNIGFSEGDFGGNIFGIGTRYTNINSWDALSINTSNGNVGIGTKNAGAWKLAVKGKIRAEEIKVETGWADYVFEKDYDLPTLEEVERHIREKGYLINIPTAEEVEANGVELGQMNKLLLEKIEELTLYTLQQEGKLKRMTMLEKEVSELRRIINELVKNN